MDEDVTERQQTPGRIFNTFAVGDTADEIELAALDKAREFFGQDCQLQIVRDYRAWTIGASSPHASSGKKYSAAVKVRVVES